MIARENYFTVKEYTAYLKDEKQLDAGTIKIAWMACRLLLEYADSHPLYEIGNQRPTLPEYFATIKGKLTNKPLTARYQVKMLEHIRHFYAWARLYKRGVWVKVSEAWVDNLRVRRSTINADKERKEHVFWEFEDILKVSRFKPETVTDERTQAAICFLFLSGMRVTAFCSLPVDCVDIQAGRIEQKPSKGVLTKNRKSAVTWLLPITELLPVVTAWDTKIRQAGSHYWFAPFEVDAWNTKISNRVIPVKTFSGRRGLFDNDLRHFCKKVGVPVLSAHKLRHAHGVYGVRNAKTVEDLKAVSQNLMHSNIGITDGIYGVLPEENVKRVIATLRPSGQASPPPALPAAVPGELSPEIIQLARLLLAQIQNQPPK